MRDPETGEILDRLTVGPECITEEVLDDRNGDGIWDDDEDFVQRKRCGSVLAERPAAMSVDLLFGAAGHDLLTQTGTLRGAAKSGDTWTATVSDCGISPAGEVMGKLVLTIDPDDTITEYGESDVGPGNARELNVAFMVPEPEPDARYGGEARAFRSSREPVQPSRPAIDPTGPATGTSRVFRSGSYDGHAQACRSAFRNGKAPSYRSGGIGFRPARSVGP